MCGKEKDNDSNPATGSAEMNAYVQDVLQESQWGCAWAQRCTHVGAICGSQPKLEGQKEISGFLK